MPTPGSHAYDVQRARLRDKLHNEGLSEERADEKASRLLHEDNSAPSPALQGDRAGGPLGERTPGGGDPGNVIGFRSPGFNDHTTMPSRYSRDGGNRSPALEWDEPPRGTVELALLCEDPDAPGGSFLHWLVTGIGPQLRSIDEGTEPPGTVWPNDYGDKGYGGPQPPVGDDPHRYIFRLYALGAPLGVRPGAALDDVKAELEEKQLATGTWIGLYVR